MQEPNILSSFFLLFLVIIELFSSFWGVRASNELSILEIIANESDLSWFHQQIENTPEFRDILNGTDLTVFAPIRDSGKDYLDISLEYLVIPGRRNVSHFQNGNYTTLTGNQIRFTRYDTPFPTLSLVNEATILEADIQASNGVIHKINQLIHAPPTDLLTTVNNPQSLPLPDNANINDVFAAIFVLNSTLDLRNLVGQGDITVFITPLSAINQETISLEGDALIRLVRNQIVEGVYFSAALQTETESNITSFQNQNLTVFNGTIRSTGNPSRASIVFPDILFTNGVVHVIDGALVPSVIPTPTGDSNNVTTKEPSEKSKKNDKTNEVAIAIGTAIPIVVLLALLALAFLVYKRKGNRDKDSKILELTEEYQSLQDIIIEHRIASGNFGEVYKGVWQGSIPVALKKLKGESNFDEFFGEIHTLKSLNHPNVIRYYGIYVKTKADVYLVTEFVAHGNLKEFLFKENSLKVLDLVGIAYQIAVGMKYLEGMNVIHRDLSLRNILVEKQEKKCLVKIADFGMSKKLENEYYKGGVTCLPVKWTAVEALKFGKFTTKSDVWSFGIVLWEIFSRGQIPYSAMSNNEVFEQVTKGYRLSPPEESPDVVKDLMVSCWEEKPENRPSFDEIVAKIHEHYRELTRSNYEADIPLELDHENPGEALYS